MEMWKKESRDLARTRRKPSHRLSPDNGGESDLVHPTQRLESGTLAEACDFGNDDPSDAAIEPSREAGAEGKLPSEIDASDENDESSDGGAQLSSAESVREDMGTITLERFPAERLHQDMSADLSQSAPGDSFSQLTDAEIMLRAGAGDEAAFEYLAAKYRRPIVGFMYRMAHNQAIAEELAQEVFLRVYRARATYRADARFTTWLYRIASNMAINHARDMKTERASSSVYLDQVDEESGTTPDVADLRPLADQDMIRNERMRHIRDQVMALPDRQRMAVVMHKYQDMDYKQIGHVLKLSESATKSLLFRAYQSLRVRLKEFV